MTMPPSPASPVIVLRAGADVPFEVLMVRRHDKVAFMAGAYVFPGGRVDDVEVMGLVSDIPPMS